VVTLAEREFPVMVEADPQGATVDLSGGPLRVESDWQPGQALARVMVEERMLVMKVAPLSSGFRLRLRGADLKVHVRSPRHAELARLMPEKTAADTSRYLLCPMPGLIVKVAVREGDEVEEGQPLVTVEAMKMENILRAERRARVRRINARAGQSMAVDDVILEFG
jgi:propionyl-CoA carboxylase alpha chain